MLTRQAVVILLDWASQAQLQEQEKMSVYLAKQLSEYYQPKEIVITGRTMEAILENWENEK